MITTRPTLGSLEDAKSFLKEKSVELTLPILDDDNLSDNIGRLKQIFYFERLPQEFIDDPVLPEPEVEHFPLLI